MFANWCVVIIALFLAWLSKDSKIMPAIFVAIAAIFAERALFAKERCDCNA